jgi:hypothetical protein
MNELEPIADSAPIENQDIALDDWASAKSRSLGKRVEALAAFYKLCQQKGVGRATPEKFEADFQVFLKSPA